MCEERQRIEVASFRLLQLGLILEQRLEFLSQHDIALDLNFTLHVSLLGIEFTGCLE